MNHSVNARNRGLHLRSVTHISADEFKVRVGPHAKEWFSTMQQGIQDADPVTAV
jgi:hypothetical protein